MSGKSLKGFKMLTLGWDDGVSFVPLDFVLGAATDPSKRVCGITKEMHHRSCGARRRQEALRKATELLLPLLQRAKALGIWADDLLMDSWFAFPSVLAGVHELLPVICRAKDLPNVLYAFRGGNSAWAACTARRKSVRGGPNIWRARWWRAGVWR